MEFKQIKDLMASMRRLGLKKLSLKKEGFELEIEREGKESPLAAQDMWDEGEMTSEREFQSLRKIQHQLPSSPQRPSSDIAQTRNEEMPGSYITSPMVGTFYTAPSPDEPTFVKVGDKVEKNTVVCIIEAMKVMNEIKAGHAGVVAEVLVDGASPVEFGTKLFRVV